MVRQQEYFNILMENYDKYEEFLDISQNSEGTAEKKYETYLDHLEAAKKQLQASWEDLAKNADIAAFLTNMTKFLSFVVDKLPFIFKWATRIFTTLNAYKLPRTLQQLGGFLGFGSVIGKNSTGPVQWMSKEAGGGILSSDKYDILSPEEKDKYTQVGSNYWFNKKEGKYLTNEQYNKLDAQQRSNYKQLNNRSQDVLEPKQGIIAGIGTDLKSILDLLVAYLPKKDIEDRNEGVAADSQKEETGEIKTAKTPKKKKGKTGKKGDTEKPVEQKPVEQKTDASKPATTNQVATPVTTNQKIDNKDKADNNAEAEEEKELNQELFKKQMKSATAMTIAIGALTSAMTTPKSHINWAYTTRKGGLAGAADFLNQNVEASNEAQFAGGVVNAISTTIGGIIGGVVSKSPAGAGLGAQAGSLLGDILNKYVVMPLIDWDYNARQERIKQAEQNLGILKTIAASTDTLISLSKSNWNASDYKQASEEVEKILNEIYSTEGENTRELLNHYLSKILGYEEDNYNSQFEVSELLDRYLNSPASERERISRALGTAEVQATNLAALQAQEEKLNALRGRYNNKSLGWDWGFDLSKTVATGAGAINGAVAGPIGAAAGAAVGLTMQTITEAVGNFAGSELNTGISYNGDKGAWALGEAYKKAGFDVSYKGNFGTFLLDTLAVGFAKGREVIIDTSNMTIDEQYEAFRKLRDQNWENPQLVDSANEILKEIESIRAETEKIYKDLNKGKVEEAALLATDEYGKYIVNMTDLQLKNLGIDELMSILGETLASNGGLIGHDVYIGDSKELTQYAKDAIEAYMKTDEKLYRLATGQAFTLTEALTYSKEHPGQTADNILQNFATAIRVSVEDLNDQEVVDALVKKFGNRTLGDLLEVPEDTRKHIEECANLLKQMGTSTGLTGENIEQIISNFPRLIPYLDDSSKMVAELMKDLDSYRIIYGENLFNELIKNEGFYNTTVLTDIKKKLSAEEYRTFMEEIGNATDINGVYTWIARGTDLGKKVSEIINENLSMSITSTIDQTIVDSVKSYETMLLDRQINNLNDQKEALSNINKQREYENKLIEAKIKLENSQKEKKRVWRAGVGWVYESDQAAIKSAQEEVDELTRQKDISALDMQLETLKATKDYLENLDEQKSFEALANIYQQWVDNNELMITSNDSLLTAMQDYLDNTSKYDMTNKSKEVTDQRAADREKVTGKLNGMWNNVQALDEASGSDSSKNPAYNYALSQFRKEFNSAINNGLISTEDFVSNNPSELFSKAALETALSGKEKSYDYWYLVRKDDKAWQVNETMRNQSNENYVWGDMQKGEAWMWDEAHKTAYDPSQYDLGQYKSLDEFAMDHPNAVIVGYGGSSEWVIIRNGQLRGANAKSYSNSMQSDFEKHSSADGYNPNLGNGGGSPRGNGGFDQVSAYANGALSLINEFGTEAIITPHGTITALPSHTGIVPADITKNLWELGEVAPSIMRTLGMHLNNMNITGNGFGNTDESFNVGTINMTVNADDSFDADEFVESIRARAMLTRNNNR